MLKDNTAGAFKYNVTVLANLSYPFNGLTAEDVEHGILSGEFVPEETFNPLVPIEWCLVLDKATGKAIAQLQHTGHYVECHNGQFLKPEIKVGWSLDAPQKFAAIWVHGGQVDCIETIKLEAHSLKGALVALCAMKIKEIGGDIPLTQGSSLEECIAFFQHYGFLERVLDSN